MKSSVTDAMPHDRAAAPALGANLALRFVLELAALAALAYWGFHTATSPSGDVILGLGAPLAAAVVWGVWAAPKSDKKRLTGWRLTTVQLAVLGSGAVALVAAGQPALGAGMAALILVNAVLLHAWGQDGAPPTRS